VGLPAFRVLRAGDGRGTLAIDRDEQHVGILLRHRRLTEEPTRLGSDCIDHAENRARRGRPPQEIAQNLPRRQERHERAELRHQRYQRQREPARKGKRLRHRHVPPSTRLSDHASNRLKHADLPEPGANVRDIATHDLVPDPRHLVPQPRRPPRRLVREKEPHHRRSQPEHACPECEFNLGRRLRRPALDDRYQFLLTMVRSSSKSGRQALLRP